MNELFLQTLPVVTGLSVRECELLKEEWQENLVPQLEKWDTHHLKRWKLFQEQLLQEKKVRPISHFGTLGSENRAMEWNCQGTNLWGILCVWIYRPGPDTDPDSGWAVWAALWSEYICCACRLSIEESENNYWTSVHSVWQLCQHINIFWQGFCLISQCPQLLSIYRNSSKKPFIWSFWREYMWVQFTGKEALQW